MRKLQLGSSNCCGAFLNCRFMNCHQFPPLVPRFLNICKDRPGFSPLSSLGFFLYLHVGFPCKTHVDITTLTTHPREYHRIKLLHFNSVRCETVTTHMQGLEVSILVLVCFKVHTQLRHSHESGNFQDVQANKLLSLGRPQ